MTAKKMETFRYHTEILNQYLRLIGLCALKTLLARIIPIVAVNLRDFPQYTLIFT
jgi:hypothetical protein